MLPLASNRVRDGESGGLTRLVRELEDRVVAAPTLTERQLRRLVYG